MVVIFSTIIENHSNFIIDWLNFFGIPNRRINSEDLTDVTRIDFQKKIIFFANQPPLDLNKITVAWYRKWNSFSVDHYAIPYESVQIKNEMISELKEISTWIFNYLTLFRNCSWISNPLNVKMNNKLFNLELAKKIGLKTPKFSIETDKKCVSDISVKKQIITKPIKDSAPLVIDKDTYQKSFTTKVTESFLQKVTCSTFFPSFIQDQISKSIEVRTIFFSDECFSTGIINQSDTGEKDIYDVKYNLGFKQSSLTYFSYKLPKNVENKIIQLMKTIGLNYGAIDFLIDKAGNIFFLEMNPLGQFMGYSIQGEHNIERKMALWLKTQYNEKK